MPRVVRMSEEAAAVSNKPDPTTHESILNVFSYHAPTHEKSTKYDALRSAAADLALEIARLCPKSADRTVALRKVREAVMYANASVALDGESIR